MTRDERTNALLFVLSSFYLEAYNVCSLTTSQSLQPNSLRASKLKAINLKASSFNIPVFNLITSNPPATFPSLGALSLQPQIQTSTYNSTPSLPVLSLKASTAGGAAAKLKAISIFIFFNIFKKCILKPYKEKP